MILSITIHKIQSYITQILLSRILALIRERFQKYYPLNNLHMKNRNLYLSLLK